MTLLNAGKSHGNLVYFLKMVAQWSHSQCSRLEIEVIVMP
ncbi:hypothetical protein ACOMHN_022823 [Nucella lapillus]